MVCLGLSAFRGVIERTDVGRLAVESDQGYLKKEFQKLTPGKKGDPKITCC